MKKKVYILDHELISPIAIGQENSVAALLSNTSADRQIQGFDVSGLPFQQAAEVREDLRSLYANESEKLKAVCKVDRKLELIAAAYGKAADRLAPLIDKLDPQRTGVILGTGAEMIPLKENEEIVTTAILAEKNAISELVIQLNTNTDRLNYMSNPYDLYSLYLAEKFQAEAFQKSVLTACVSSTQAIAQGYDAIARNQADVVIAGGTDSIINLIALISFGKLGVIAESDGKIACRPFDNNRYGTIAGEAAGFVILASEDFVNKHQFKPIAQLLGYGNTLDAYKITAPDPSGTQMAKAISNALKNAALTPEEIDYYYAHGTGTRQNDGVELAALKMALGEHAATVPISSTKDRHGHAIAAAGIQELSLLLSCMKANLAPGNLNLMHPIDSAVNLLRVNTKMTIKHALTSNFSFGGINTVLAVKNELK